MAKVRGLSLERLDELGDKYSASVIRSLRTVLQEASEKYEEVDDLRIISQRWNEEIESHLAEELQESWLAGSNNIMDQLLNKDNVVVAAIKIPKVGTLAAIEYIKTRLNFLKLIGEQAWRLARDQIEEAISEGESIREIKDRIVDSLNVSSARAEVIARTEVVGAANAGSHEQIKATGLAATKEWLATNDSRTRDDHREADGQTVALDEKFNVGGFPMDRPHDPAGPAEEVVNCRCTLVYDIPDSEFTESDQGQTLVASAEHTGAMIALVPSEKDLDRLAIEDGEPREELHLTLWFLGEAVNFDEDSKNSLESGLRELCLDLELSAVTGMAFGVNHWNPFSDDPAWVLGVGNTNEGDNLEDFKAISQEVITDFEIPVNHTPWVPHVTLAYSKDLSFHDELQSRVGEITFDKLRLAFGDDVRDISLAKNPDMQSGEGNAME